MITNILLVVFAGVVLGYVIAKSVKRNVSNSQIKQWIKENSEIADENEIVIP